MKLLPETFTEKGFTYDQVQRNEHAAIYRQTWGINGSPAYEVVVPQVGTQRRTITGWETCEPYEHYPSARQWGDQAWTFVDLERAKEKLEEISENALSTSGQTRRNRFNSSDGAK